MPERRIASELTLLSTALCGEKFAWLSSLFWEYGQGRKGATRECDRYGTEFKVEWKPVFAKNEVANSLRKSIIITRRMDLGDGTQLPHAEGVTPRRSPSHDRKRVEVLELGRYWSQFEEMGNRDPHLGVWRTSLGSPQLFDSLSSGFYITK
jgi:hypothetical protein